MALPDDDERRLHNSASKAFTPAAPVNGISLFAGRKEQVRRVIDAINQIGQHAIIYGERGVGKTSLSNVLRDFLEDPNIGFPIFAPRITCDGGDDFSAIWRKVFLAIKEMGIDRKVPLPECPLFEIIDADPEDLIEYNITPDVVRRNLALVAKPIILIVIIDEFDRITNPQNQRLFSDTIKVLSDHAVDATTILVGVAGSVDDLIKEHHSVERALVQVPMPRMSEEEIFEIIRNGLERLDEMKIENLALKSIAFLAKGLPFYAHLFGLHSARHAISRRDLTVKREDIPNALKGALEGVSSSIRTEYRTAVKSKRTKSLFPSVLLACAMAKTDELGYFRPADVKVPYEKIRGDGETYHTSSFANQLAQFCERSRGPVIEKDGFQYRFINPLMQPYVLMDGFSKGLIKNI